MTTRSDTLNLRVRPVTPEGEALPRMGDYLIRIDSFEEPGAYDQLPERICPEPVCTDRAQSPAPATPATR